MIQSINPIIVIPSRLAATRLPNKPLLNIDGLPMIIQVINRALEADIAPVLVATADKAIADIAINHGVKAVLTDPTLLSGTDRIAQALQSFDIKKSFNIVINLQGDLPTIEKSCIQYCLEVIKTNNFLMSTVGVKIDSSDDIRNPNIVKAVVNFQHNSSIGQAIDFKRELYSDQYGDLYHHIGIYGYTRESLEKFTSLPPTKRELTEKLEQLRALDNNYTIGFKESYSVPIGVDTQDDLHKAEVYLQSIK